MALILLTFVATDLRSRSGVIMGLRASGNKHAAWPEPAINLGPSERFPDAHSSDGTSSQTHTQPLGEGRRSKVPLRPTLWRPQSRIQINEEAYKERGLGGENTVFLSLWVPEGRASVFIQTSTQVWYLSGDRGEKWTSTLRDFPSPAHLRCPWFPSKSSRPGGQVKIFIL